MDGSRRRTLPDAESGLKQGLRSNAGREGTPVLTLTVVQHESSGEGPRWPGSLIDGIVREGARRMLAEVLGAEVDAYITALTGEPDQNGRSAVNVPHLVALVRAGATFINGKLAERPAEDAA